MVVRGTIFYNSKFPFKNGERGKKYLILLNTPSKGESYFLVKTTSQRKDKPITPGCIKKRSLFFIPARRTFFPENTWVQLYELYEEQEAEGDPEFRIVSNLDSKMIDQIIECLLASQGDDISPHQKKLLKVPIGDSLLKLKEYFGGKRP